MATKPEGENGMAAGGRGGVLKAMGPGELAMCYGVDIGTFRRWLVPHEAMIGARTGRFYNPRQVGVIVSVLGPW